MTPAFLEPGPVAACREVPVTRARLALLLCERAHLADPTGESAARFARLLVDAGRYGEVDAVAARVTDPRWAGLAAASAGHALYLLGEPEATSRLRTAIALLPAHHRHAEVVSSAHLLLGLLRERGGFAERLAVADLYVHHAFRLRDPRSIGTAVRSRAAIYDSLGDEKQAVSDFTTAGRWLASWPDEVAWIQLHQALFILDLGGPRARRAREVLPLLAQAEATAATVEPEQRDRVADLPNAIQLNRAYAYRYLGDLERAERELAAIVVPDGQPPSPNHQLVAGLIAAERGEAGAFAIVDGAIAARDRNGEGVAADYVAEAHVELGEIAERAGDVVEAERRYRLACAAVDLRRADAETLDLRPWVMARRRRPYEKLFVLLARQQRAGEAMAVAEVMLASTFLDAAAGDGGARVHDVLRASASASSHDAPKLAERMHGRELMMFVEIDKMYWRLHAAASGRIEVTALPDDTAAAIERWLGAPDDVDAAAAAGERLLPPLESAPERAMYVAFGGDLDLLPFAALRRDGRLLVEQRTLVRIPGAFGHACRPRKAATGAPVFVANAFGDLPASTTEATALHAAYGGELLLGPAATVAAIREVRDASLLHVAVHGEVGSSGGMMKLADGSLDSAEILGSQIAPDVVVLAGCATAGSVDPEGWRALPKAFLIAGSRAVVATVRSVPDAEASTVVAELYRRGGKDHPAAALAEAQRHLATTLPPSTWGSFTAWEPGCAPD